MPLTQGSRERFCLKCNKDNLCQSVESCVCGFLIHHLAIRVVIITAASSAAAAAAIVSIPYPLTHCIHH